MNAKHILAAFSVVGIVSAALVGCGDSAGTGGSGGTGTTATGTTTTTSSSKSSTSVTSTATGTGTGTSTGTGMTCIQMCQAMHPTGNMILTKAVTAGCGCQMTAAMSPCKTECTGNPACADPPMAATGACATCLDTESAKGAGSACTLAAAQGTACQADADCKALVICGTGC